LSPEPNDPLSASALAPDEKPTYCCPANPPMSILPPKVPPADTIKFVVDASDAVRFVVEAYGATSDEPENVRNAFEVS
jgi:hypothetical protein